MKCLTGYIATDSIVKDSLNDWLCTLTINFINDTQQHSITMATQFSLNLIE